MSIWTPISPWRIVAGSGRNVAIGAASVSSSAVGAGVHAVLLSATSNCHVVIGPGTQTALATSTLIKATDPPLALGCSPGDLVAVIQDSAAGVLNVTDVTH